MTYLSVGTATIYQELFSDIENGQKGKPYGGLWATKHPENSKYNSWIEYLNNRKNYHLLFYKSYTENPFIIPATLITLKDNANIFYIKTQNDLEFLIKKFPSNDNWIDFASLSHYYDGIYLDYESLISSITNPTYKEKISSFALSSLLLFNSNSINYYQTATIEIEPFDYEYGFEYFYYDIKINDKKEEIKPLNPAAISLIKKMSQYIKQNNFSNYHDCISQLKEMFNSELQEVLQSMNVSQKSSIQNLLIRKSLKNV